MRCHLPSLGALLAVAALIAPAAEPAKGSLDSLVKNSPFGSATAPRNPGAESSQLEFRGMFVDQGEQYFSFHESATNTSQWVGMKETGTPYTVQSYDSATNTVKVLFRNQPFTLSLKRSQIIVQAPPPPQANNPSGPGPAPNAVVGPPAGSDEAARLAQVAEEIRRRRALRAQGGAQPTVNNTPPPLPQPQPNRP
ncbi:MAG TPA: hypothetical protein VHN79_03780 [Lacunisphaera sp.]|nr:hypothetical protein [Lacunisphaera sp.]